MLCLPFISYSQEAKNQDAMKKLGYDIVDLNHLQHHQKKSIACQSCPAKKKNSFSTLPINQDEEIKQLERSIGQLLIAEKALYLNNPVDSALVLKYQKARQDSYLRIKTLKKNQ
jgi:hypothetical protein